MQKHELRLVERRADNEIEDKRPTGPGEGGVPEDPISQTGDWLTSLSAQSLSHSRLFATPWTVSHQAPLSMGFSRQEYWSGLPFPPPGDLPNLRD